jgi:hypothetical protein
MAAEEILFPIKNIYEKIAENKYQQTMWINKKHFAH